VNGTPRFSASSATCCLPSHDPRASHCFPLADRMGTTVRSHPVDHMLLLTAPALVTELLLGVADKVEHDLMRAGRSSRAISSGWSPGGR
jgi:hypothetical protein